MQNCKLQHCNVVVVCNLIGDSVCFISSVLNFCVESVWRWLELIFKNKTRTYKVWAFRHKASFSFSIKKSMFGFVTFTCDSGAVSVSFVSSPQLTAKVSSKKISLRFQVNYVFSSSIKFSRVEEKPKLRKIDLQAINLKRFAEIASMNRIDFIRAQLSFLAYFVMKIMIVNLVDYSVLLSMVRISSQACN